MDERVSDEEHPAWRLSAEAIIAGSLAEVDSPRSQKLFAEYCVYVKKLENKIGVEKERGRMTMPALKLLAKIVGCPADSGYPCQHVVCDEHRETMAECWAWIADPEAESWRKVRAEQQAEEVIP